MEEWKDVPGYEGLYQVSNHGRVKSTPRRTTKGGILKTKVDSHGYAEVTLSRENVQRSVRVHRIVAEVFISNTEHKPQVNHKNGDKLDNRVENLEWATASENIQHSYHVLGNKGSAPWKDKPRRFARRFSDDEVREIRASGKSSAQIARESGVSKQTIQKIRHKRIYREVI